MLLSAPHNLLSRTHLKNVFWPPAFGGIGASLKILNIQQYASGFKLGPAACVPAKPLGEDGILNQNPIFEMGSSLFILRAAYIELKMSLQYP